MRHVYCRSIRNRPEKTLLKFIIAITVAVLMGWGFHPMPSTAGQMMTVYAINAGGNNTGSWQEDKTPSPALYVLDEARQFAVYGAGSERLTVEGTISRWPQIDADVPDNVLGSIREDRLKAGSHSPGLVYVFRVAPGRHEVQIYLVEGLEKFKIETGVNGNVMDVYETREPAGNPVASVRTYSVDVRGTALLVSLMPRSPNGIIQIAGLKVSGERLPDPVPEPVDVRYIIPDGQGSGTSWTDGASLRSLNKLIRQLPPGGEVWIHAGLGVYHNDSPIALNAGGAPDAPIVIRGVDPTQGLSRRPAIKGSRAFPYTPDGPRGKEVFRLVEGADNLVFKHLEFLNQGNGCFRISAPIEKLTISDVVARNVRRFVENLASGDRTDATVSGFTLRRSGIHGYSRGAIRLQYNSHDILIEDVLGDSERQKDNTFAMGLLFDGTVHDAVVRRSAMNNSHWSVSDSDYWNGDGFVSERGVSDIRYEDAFAAGSTDGGFDLKSNNTRLIRAVSIDNKQNFRLWGKAVLEDCVSRFPKSRGGSGSQVHIGAFSDKGNITVKNCRIEDDAIKSIVFGTDEEGSIMVQGGTVTHNGTLKQGNVELKNVTVKKK